MFQDHVVVVLQKFRFLKEVDPKFLMLIGEAVVKAGGASHIFVDEPKQTSRELLGDIIEVDDAFMASEKETYIFPSEPIEFQGEHLDEEGALSEPILIRKVPKRTNSRGQGLVEFRSSRDDDDWLIVVDVPVSRVPIENPIPGLRRATFSPKLGAVPHDLDAEGHAWGNIFVLVDDRGEEIPQVSHCP